jgi:hypothetical protein
MSWANLDDRLHAHPKVRRLQRIPFAGAEAFGIWAWCLSWCRAYSPTEGRVTVEDVAIDWHADPEHMAEVFELLALVKLVDLVEGGYVIHDWTDWQLDGNLRQVLAGKARAASAVRVGGRFAPNPDQPDQRAGEPVTSRATPLHATPHRTSPRLDHGFEAVRETVTALALPHPAPKPVRARR